MELKNVKGISVLGDDVQVSIPNNFVAYDSDTIKTIISDPSASVKTIAAGMMDGEITVMTGDFDVWSWPINRVKTDKELKNPIVGPLLNGIMVLIVDDDSNLVVVPTLEIMAHSTHALNNSELQMPTYNDDKDNVG